MFICIYILRLWNWKWIHICMFILIYKFTRIIIHIHPVFRDYGRPVLWQPLIIWSRRIRAHPGPGQGRISVRIKVIIMNWIYLLISHICTPDMYILGIYLYIHVYIYIWTSGAGSGSDTCTDKGTYYECKYICLIANIYTLIKHVHVYVHTKMNVRKSRNFNTGQMHILILIYFLNISDKCAQDRGFVGVKPFLPVAHW